LTRSAGFPAFGRRISLDRDTILTALYGSVRKIDLSNFQVATSETARDINRRIVLNLIRKHQPVSRADLARYSGLQRSTVSAIAEQLIAERWIVEGALGQAPRGRKPTFLHLNTERAGIIGIDLRPVTTTLVLARLDLSLMAQTSLPTEGTPAQFLARLTRQVSDLIQSQPGFAVEGIGVSLPGRVDPRSQRLVFAPNLEWHDLDLKTPLERATGLPVELENAANACALAEIWFGRHADSVRNVIAVTVSEGIGVGLILNGQLVRGPSGMAGEFGHVSLDETGPVCNCGNRGCWEVYASNLAATRYYGDQTASTRRAEPKARSTITLSDIIARARQGDARAEEALARMAHYLGAGLAMLVSGFSPDEIVIAGEVSVAWDRVGPVVMRVIKERCPALFVPQIRPTDSATQPRLRGAIALILQKHFGAPQIF
jgi:predicted NBD/HSP70 family sugar kinase